MRHTKSANECVFTACVRVDEREHACFKCVCVCVKSIPRVCVPLTLHLIQAQQPE